MQHNMLREIHEQPKAVGDTLQQEFKQARTVLQELDAPKITMVYFTGSGTSYHACLAANYVLSALTRISSTTLPASEFSSWVKKSGQPGTITVALSQSGESVDVLAAIRSASDAGMRTIGITNSDHSSLGKQTEFQLFGRAGEEKALAATKSYTATLAAAYALVMELAHSLSPDSESIELLEQGLRNAADQMQLTLTLSEDQARTLASKFAGKQLHFMLGSGPNYPTALEGALKLKECCNLYAEGFATREFLHGPMQLVDSRTPVFLLEGPKESEQVAQLGKSFLKFGAPTVVIKRRGGEIMEEGCDTIYVARDIEELFSPLVYVIPLQLYAFYSALERGLNPDSPVKLTKVVK